MRKKASIKYLLAFVFLGYGLAVLVIPLEYREGFTDIKWILIGTEALFFSIEFYLLAKMVFKLPLFLRTWAKIRMKEPFFLLALKSSLEEVFSEKKFVRLMSFELSAWYYAFFSWKRGKNLIHIHITKTPVISLLM